MVIMLVLTSELKEEATKAYYQNPEDEEKTHSQKANISKKKKSLVYAFETWGIEKA